MSDFFQSWLMHVDFTRDAEDAPASAVGNMELDDESEDDTSEEEDEGGSDSEK